jgi:hypothetical protein
MIYGVTYSDDQMTISRDKCIMSMKKNGVDEVEGNIALDYHFCSVNSSIIDHPRGAGYWLWKPYVISKMMERCCDGDILIYADAGVEFVNHVSHIIDRMDENIFLFTNTHPNHHWTKRETLDAMMPGWENTYHINTPWPQVQASVIFFKVCQETRNFVKRWLLWCQMPGLIDDSKGAQKPYFQDHRHDQSILTILATQAGYKLHWWPTAYAEHIRVSGDDYPVMFNHHRKRNNEYEW